MVTPGVTLELVTLTFKVTSKEALGVLSLRVYTLMYYDVFVFVRSMSQTVSPEGSAGEGARGYDAAT